MDSSPGPASIQKLWPIWTEEERHDFREYTKSRLAWENIDFWEKVQEFKTMENDEARTVHGRAIHCKYLKGYKLNVNSESRQPLPEGIFLPKEWFFEVEKEIEGNLNESLLGQYTKNK